MQNSTVYDMPRESDPGRQRKLITEKGRRGATRLETLRIFTLKATGWQAFILVAVVVCATAAAGVVELNARCLCFLTTRTASRLSKFPSQTGTRPAEDYCDFGEAWEKCRTS